jgi:hypothetical protein
MDTSMTRTLATLALAAIAALATTAAQAVEATQDVPPAATQKTRAEVKAELAEAIRTGDIWSAHAGMKLNELHPAQYPAKPAVAGKTREEVRAELAEAGRPSSVHASR